MTTDRDTKDTPGPTPRWAAVVRQLVSGAVILGTGLFLYLALKGEHQASPVIRDYLVENAERATGALNLVTSIYLGFRAYDTLGETVVLLLAVSGVLFFVGRDE